jgi:UDP-GlcNAc3NAcA epimerase
VPKVVTLVGARPQFIKVAPVSRALAAVGGIEEAIIHSGQHYDERMSSIFFDELGIAPPTVNLAVGSGSHGAQTGQMITAIETELMRSVPQLVLVYGDTNTTLAAALAAVKLEIPIAHVEAGVRCHSLAVPEEVNRRVTDHVSTLLFTPTDLATENLRREGISGGAVHQVGDVMLDAALHFSARARERSTVLRDLGLREGDYALVTIHRPNHTDDAGVRANVLDAMLDLARERAVVWPVHPRLEARLSTDERGRIRSSGIHLIPPVGYLDMLRLESSAAVIVTDSGGVQREAFFLGRPAVVVRAGSAPPEWPELAELGWTIVVDPTTPQAVREAVSTQLDGGNRREGRPFGDGDAARRIATTISRHLGCV